MNALENLARVRSSSETVNAIAEALETRQIVDVKLPSNTVEAFLRKHFGNPELVTEDPSTKLVYDEQGRYLGTTKLQYETVQPIAFFALFLWMLYECGYERKFDLDTLQYFDWDNGRLVEFQIDNRPLAFTNSAGNAELILQKVSGRTGFGGNYRHIIGDYDWREICTNGMMGWGVNNQLKLKHTGLNNTKIKLWCDQLAKVLEAQETKRELYLALDKVEVNQQRVNAFARTLAGFSQTEKLSDASVKKQNIYQSIQEGIALEFARTGATAFGLLQGATYYTNHLSSSQRNYGTGEAIRTKEARNVNDLAQKLVLAMV